MDKQMLLQSIPKRELLRQELRPCVTGEENSLAIAIREPKIIDCDIEDISKALKFVMLKIGLREKNMPAKLEKEVLINHIIKNFGQHTCGEIKLAFDMAMDNQLDIEDPKHYENFSCMYFSEIMNAYRKWSKDAYRVLEKEMIKPVQKIYTDVEILNLRRQEIETAFQAMKRGKMPIIFPYWYDVLKQDGLIKLRQEEQVPCGVEVVEGETIDEFFVRRLATTNNIYVHD